MTLEEQRVAWRMKMALVGTRNYGGGGWTSCQHCGLPTRNLWAHESRTHRCWYEMDKGAIEHNSPRYDVPPHVDKEWSKYDD